MSDMEQRAWITIDNFPAASDEAAWEPFAAELERAHADVGAVLSWRDRNVAEVIMSADVDDHAEFSRQVIVRVTEALQTAGLGHLYPSALEIEVVDGELAAAPA